MFKLYQGVRYLKNQKKFSVGISDLSITEGDKRISLGTYTSYKEAIEVRKKAELELGYYVGNFMTDYKDKELTSEMLKKIIHYNMDTGIFTWATTINGHKVKGKQVGNKNRDMRVGGKEYLRTSIANKIYAVHRLAFLYMLGSFPPETVDHINGDGTCNKWSNLRAVSILSNNQNTRLRHDNTSGETGVSFDKNSNKWSVQVSSVYYGSYQDKQEAIMKVRQIRNEKGFHKNHGQKREL